MVVDAAGADARRLRNLAQRGVGVALAAEQPRRRRELGPVLSAMSFKDEDHAVQLANATQFGLVAGVLLFGGEVSWNAPLPPQISKSRHASNVALAPRLDAAAGPFDFVFDQFGAVFQLAFFLFQHHGRPFIETAIAIGTDF